MQVQEIMAFFKKYREDMGIMIKDVSERSNIPRMTIHRMENNQTVPKMDTFLRYIDALGFELEVSEHALGVKLEVSKKKDS